MRRKIYLAGPVEKVEDGVAWRNELEEEYENIEFVNPPAEGFDPMSQRYKMFHWCLRNVQLSDMIIVNYIEGAETYGTPMEAFHAWLNGIPVLTWSLFDPAEMPQFLVAVSDKISDDVDELIRYGWDNDSY